MVDKVLNKQLDSFFQIDRENNKVNEIQTKEGDLDDYIETLTEKIITNKNNRHFEFTSDRKEVLTYINEIMKQHDSHDAFLVNAKGIANRLLETEIKTQKRMGALKELQKGSLIISKFSDQFSENILISKVEHETFLDSSDFKKMSGLPYEKGTLKTCLIQIDYESKDIMDVIITDSNPSISKYWSESFLELDELKSNESNTRTSFNAMDQFISKKLQKQSPNDYTMIRNHLISYYRAQEDFSYENMLQAVFGKYQPEDTKIDINRLRTDANELPEKKSFDRVFSIKPDVIKARIRKVVKLNSVSELRLTSSSDKFESLIRSKVIEGEKVLQIKIENEEAFKMFNFNDE